MMRYVLPLSLLLLVSCSKEESFIKTYGGEGPDRGIHLIQSSDNNYVVVGNTMTRSNGLDVYLLKCSASGDTLWTRCLGGPGDDNGWCIKETADDGFIIVGFTQKDTETPNDILLIKTDSEGHQQWRKTYGGTADDIGWSLVVTEDGGYAIAAQTDSQGAGELDAFLLKTNTTGDSLWSRTYGGPLVDRVFSIDKTVDHGFVMAGITYSYSAGDRDAYLIKTDSLGEMIWQRSYGGSGYDNAHTVIVNDMGEIILTGYGQHWGDSLQMDVFLKQISSLGKDVWTRTYGGPANDRAMTVVETQERGYILTGFTQSFGQGNWDVYVVKTTATGDTVWTNSYGTPAPDHGYDIIQDHRGDFWVTGWTHGFGSPEGDLLLIKQNGVR